MSPGALCRHRRRLSPVLNPGLRISRTSLHDLIYRDGLALTKQPPTIRTQQLDSLRGLKTFTLSGSVEDLDQVRDSAGRPLR